MSKMKRINVISIEQALPAVFLGSEHEESVVRSEVWMTDAKFERPRHYLVEAESGTGKSSLCSYIYGYRRDFTGRISFDGRDIRTFSIAEWCEIRRRHLAYLPQDMKLFPELTVLENIQMKNRLTDCLSEERIMEMLDRLEIAHKAHQLARNLSIGQQQRVSIIRALSQPFDFVILDEPVSHLDERNNRMAAALIKEEAEKNSASVISTSVGNPLLLEELLNEGSVQKVKL